VDAGRAACLAQNEHSEQVELVGEVRVLVEAASAADLRVLVVVVVVVGVFVVVLARLDSGRLVFPRRRRRRRASLRPTSLVDAVVATAAVPPPTPALRTTGHGIQQAVRDVVS